MFLQYGLKVQCFICIQRCSVGQQCPAEFLNLRILFFLSLNLFFDFFLVLHGKLGYGGKGSNDEEEVIIIPIAVANPLSDFDFVVEALELAGADRERSM